MRNFNFIDKFCFYVNEDSSEDLVTLFLKDLIAQSKTNAEYHQILIEFISLMIGVVMGGRKDEGFDAEKLINKLHVEIFETSPKSKKALFHYMYKNYFGMNKSKGKKFFHFFLRKDYCLKFMDYLSKDIKQIRAF